MEKGCVHLYIGDGKGKTTAALGLLVRAHGAGPVSYTHLFSPVLREDYRIGAPYYGTYTEIFSTNDERFGGTGCDNPAPIHSEDVPGHGYEQSISLTVSPMSVMFFRVDKEERPKEEKTVKKASGRVPKTKQAKVDE